MDLQTLSDQELLQHCLHSQDQACWKEFVRRFQPSQGGMDAGTRVSGPNAMGTSPDLCTWKPFDTNRFAVLPDDHGFPAAFHRQLNNCAVSPI
jgi:hypothetical protein